MKISPPPLVNVGGRTIIIRIDPTLEAWGEYRADDKEIILASRTLDKQSNLRETLRHEILHASFDIGGIAYLEGYEEEAIVRCIENIFHPAWETVRKQLSIA